MRNLHEHCTNVKSQRSEVLPYFQKYRLPSLTFAPTLSRLGGKVIIVLIGITVTNLRHTPALQAHIPFKPPRQCSVHIDWSHSLVSAHAVTIVDLPGRESHTWFLECPKATKPTCVCAKYSTGHCRDPSESLAPAPEAMGLVVLAFPEEGQDPRLGQPTSQQTE